MPEVPEKALGQNSGSLIPGSSEKRPGSSSRYKKGSYSHAPAPAPAKTESGAEKICG